MYSERFLTALHEVISVEGGYNDIAQDRGGATNLGISLRFLQSVRPGATAADIRRLTIDDAKALYHQYFWQAYRCGDLPAPIDVAFFSIVVNLPPTAAVRVLQNATSRAGVRVTVDGVLGPQTLMGAASADRTELKRRLTAELCRYYHDLIMRDNSQGVFAAGWFYRAATLFI